MGKIYQMTTLYTKLPYIMPNGYKIFQMIIKYNTFHSKALQNLPKLGFFGLKTNHLATLAVSFRKRATADQCLKHPWLNLTSNRNRPGEQVTIRQNFTIVLEILQVS
jgi:hypothetical protein